MPVKHLFFKVARIFCKIKNGLTAKRKRKTIGLKVSTEQKVKATINLIRVGSAVVDAAFPRPVSIIHP